MTSEEFWQAVQASGVEAVVNNTTTEELELIEDEALARYAVESKEILDVTNNRLDALQQENDWN